MYTNQYSLYSLVKIAKRENNTKRSYVIVNPLQAKHIPSSPKATLELYSSLADIIKKAYPNEKLLLIGFAETATAIGAHCSLLSGMPYIQTTRENLIGQEYIYFSEEHSHATEQKIVKSALEEGIKNIDRIVFIEDELTTGKTILNIINILKRLYPSITLYSAASVLNGMNEENISRYKGQNIDLHFLLKIAGNIYEEKIASFVNDGSYIQSFNEGEGKSTPFYKILTSNNFLDARRGVDSSSYKNFCQSLYESLLLEFNGLSKGNKVLFLGTEEFMYPSIYIGSKLEEMGMSVFCHSTTRSPICVSKDKDYPLHSRLTLKSLYDSERTTFLYDMDTYDKVFIITDAPLFMEDAINFQKRLNELAYSLKPFCSDIVVLQCKRA